MLSGSVQEEVQYGVFCNACLEFTILELLYTAIMK